MEGEDDVPEVSFQHFIKQGFAHDANAVMNDRSWKWPAFDDFADDDDPDLALATQLDAETNRYLVENLALEIPPFATRSSDMELTGQADNTRPDLAGINNDNCSDIVEKEDETPSLRGGGLAPKKEPSHSTSLSRPLNNYSDFVSYIVSRKCPKCNSVIVNSSRSVEAVFGSWSSGASAVNSNLKCTRCSTTSCIGCGSRSSPGKTTFAIGEKPTETHVTWCCSRGRLFLIWVLLCGFDQQYCAEKQREAAMRGTGNIMRGSGVGYGGGRLGFYGNEDDLMMPNAGGWGGGLVNPYVAPSRPDSGKVKAQSAQQKSDQFYQILFAILVELLPSVDKKTTMDTNPHTAVVSLIISSKVLHKAAELLRNDSLQDATKRRSLYEPMLSFLGVIVKHPITAAKSMFQERIVFPDTVNLLTLSFPGKSATGKAKTENAPSLEEALRNLNVQSEMMLRGANGNQQEFKNSEGQSMLSLCRQVTNLSSHVLAKKRAGGGNGGKNTTEQHDNRVTEAADQLLFASHKYAPIASHLRHSAPGRMKRLITEITSLKTSLPPGIFVKFAASRLDMMKALIIGPCGTPYENGLFEFDLHCPAEYPHGPPMVNFKGTGGGRAKINPNLHLDGKVCLSLLGTWPGESWRPGESTILQVLISIQAMILCDEPICNEPSQERMRGSAVSQMYNRSRWALTLRYAVLDWLINPPNLWKDIAAQHFKKNGVKIMETAMNWERIAQIPIQGYSRYPHSMGTPDIQFMMMSGPRHGPPPESISSLRPQVQTALQQRFGLKAPSNTSSRGDLSPGGGVHGSHGSHGLYGGHSRGGGYSSHGGHGSHGSHGGRGGRDGHGGHGGYGGYGGRGGRGGHGYGY